MRDEWRCFKVDATGGIHRLPQPLLIGERANNRSRDTSLDNIHCARVSTRVDARQARQGEQNAQTEGKDVHEDQDLVDRTRLRRQSRRTGRNAVRRHRLRYGARRALGSLCDIGGPNQLRRCGIVSARTYEKVKNGQRTTTYAQRYRANHWPNYRIASSDRRRASCERGLWQ